MWTSLSLFAQSYNNFPWIVLGTLMLLGASLRRWVGMVIGLSIWMNLISVFFYCELDDLRYVGCQFTSSNNQRNVCHIATKIGRVLVNEEWMKTFPLSNAVFCAPVCLTTILLLF